VKNVKQSLSIAAAGALVAALPLLAQGPPSWDRFTELHDTDRDGRVTREELAATSGHFETLDADGDGAITADDLAARHAAMLLARIAHRADADGDGTLTAAEADAWFTARDGNGDGRLDAADFAAGARRGRGPGKGGPGGGLDGDGIFTREDLAAVFARFDADGDGALSAEERPEAPRGHHRRDGFHGLRGADTDGDGAISRAEWDAAVAARPHADPERAAARFAALDADGDGRITADELPRHRRGHRPGRGPGRGPGG
jgi:Ca2+-binding EF-hand superfamily protein